MTGLKFGPKHTHCLLHPTHSPRTETTQQLFKGHAIGEVYNYKVVTAPGAYGFYPDRCAAIPLGGGDGQCLSFPDRVMDPFPPDAHCPCITETSNGVDPGKFGITALPGTGKPLSPNPHKDAFTYEKIVDGFITPTDFSFTDSGEMYIVEKQGRVWYHNLNTGEKKVWLDLTHMTHNAGDRGMLGVTTHPDFANNRFVFLLFTLNPYVLDQDDIALGPSPPAEVPTAQVLVRIEDIGTSPKMLNGKPDLIYLIGGDATVQSFEPFKQPIVTGHNSHAIGKVKFGLDGTLLVSSGEGAHWDFDNAPLNGDWGQGTTPYDYLVEKWFGKEQNIGSMRSQSMKSLSGKVLRIHAGTGRGICEGSGFAVLNPFCDGDPNSVASKIWASGLRNPFQMTVKPLRPGDPYDNGPGVVYIGEVGGGGFEEVNAITEGGQNFGWPCWEGPIVMPTISQNTQQDDPNFYNITAPNGDLLNCRYVFNHVKTEIPYYYYQRRDYEDQAGYFRAATYLGQGFEGNCVGGVEFYAGDLYPQDFHGGLFLMDFAQGWIHVLKDREFPYNDIFDTHMDFTQTEYAGAMYSFRSDPVTKDICFLTRNEGSIIRIKYQNSNAAPTVEVSASPSSASAPPLEVTFSFDGTRDRENDFIFAVWDFGDGSDVSYELRPVHTYTTAGQFECTVTVTDAQGSTSTASVSISTNNRAPSVRILTPTTNDLMLYYEDNTEFTFTAEVDDEVGADIDQLEWKWEVHIVHNDHRHIESRLEYTPTWTADIGAELGDTHKGARANFAVLLQVTDAHGLVGNDEIWISSRVYAESIVNSPPETAFTFTSIEPYEVGQPVLFNAQEMDDPDLDNMMMSWDFGDGTFAGNDVLTSHIFTEPGTYTVTLTARDNWWASKSASHDVTVIARTFMPPILSPLRFDRYSTFNVTLSSVADGVEIWFTLDGSEPGKDLGTSTLYTDPVPIEFDLGATVTVKAISLPPGGTVPPSRVVSFDYVFQHPPCEKLALASGCNFVCFHDETVLSSANLTQLLREVETPNRLGEPPADDRYSVVFEKAGLYGDFDAEKEHTAFVLYVDAGVFPGRTVQTRVSYDFNGDGVLDRIETFQQYATDPDPNRYEKYTGSKLNVIKTVGSYAPLVNGRVRFEIWQALGPAGDVPMTIRTDAPFKTEPWNENSPVDFSSFSIPYSNTTRQGEDVCQSKAAPCDGAFDRCGVCDGDGLSCVLEPEITPGSGVQIDDFSVTVAAADALDDGAAFYYTIDGTTPTEATGTRYTGPVSITYQEDELLTFSAIAVISGRSVSSASVVSFAMPSSDSCAQLVVEKDCNLQCLNQQTNIPSSVLVINRDNTGITYTQAPPENSAYVATFLIDGLHGTFAPEKGVTRFSFWVDGGNLFSRAVGARISYDFTNDGSFDRVETFNFKATAPVGGEYELYSSIMAGFLSITGSDYQNMVGGVVQIEMWQPLGAVAAPMKVYVGEAGPILLPYSEMTRVADDPATPCDLSCIGGVDIDECGVCGGLGRTGCDNECFSVKEFDECGECDGPGKTGCDNECSSTKVVDSCGICGGPGGCIGGAPTCSSFFLSVNSPGALVCSYSETNTDSIIVLPKLTQNPGLTIPSSSKIASFSISGLYGFYDNLHEAAVSVRVDAGSTPGLGIRMALKFDFNGDGATDRLEEYIPCNTDPVYGYEACVWYRNDNNLVGKLPQPFNTFLNGSVTLMLWSAYGNEGANDISILIGGDTDLSDSSYVQIPFTDSTYWSHDPSVTDATCDDSILNGQETGLDCGGPSCPECPSYEWVAGDWSEECVVPNPCNDTEQYRSRQVICSFAGGPQVDDALCFGPSRPEDSEVCPFVPCFSWKTLAWEPAACPNCGASGSNQTRTVYCESYAGSTVAASNCNVRGEAPVAYQACPPVNPCPVYAWHVSAWVPEVCPSCGTQATKRDREVTCLYVTDGTVVADANCPLPDRPNYSEYCPQPLPCSDLSWISTEWDPPCPACGTGEERQSRTNQCVDEDGIIVANEYCVASEGFTPPTEQGCVDMAIVDSCGLCGGSTVCELGAENECRVLSFSSIPIVSGSGSETTFNLSCLHNLDQPTEAVVTVPSSNGVDPAYVEPDSSLTLSFQIDGLFGYNIPFSSTEMQLVLDANSNAGLRTRTQVQYDFEGDGVWDRTEMFEIVATNDVTNFETFNLYSSDILDFASDLSPFAVMTGGSVRVSMWSSSPRLGAVDVRFGGEDGQDGSSWIKIPYVTVYWAQDVVTPAPSCTDSVLNGDEEGMDCGGSTCDPCPKYEWVAGDWEPECGSACVVGTRERSRSVVCMDVVSNVTVTNVFCDLSTKPSNTSICPNLPCFTWIPGQWNMSCPVCGGTPGTVRSRSVRCYDNNLVLPDSSCDATSKPTSEQVCAYTVCQGYEWSKTDWSPSQCPQCSVEEVPQLLRDVFCSNDTHDHVPEERCENAGPKPSPVYTCSSIQPCTNATEWRSVTLWSGFCPDCALVAPSQTRSIACVDVDSAEEVSDSLCDPLSRIATSRVCPDTRVIDSCGVCGGAGGCETDEPECRTLVLSRRPSETLQCSYSSDLEELISYIPSSDLIHTLKVPPPADRRLEFSLNNLNGYYLSGEETSISLELDAGKAVGLRVRTRILYDFDGDDSWDREEVYRVVSTDPIDGFESFSLSANDADFADSAELGVPKTNVSSYRNMTNGRVLVQLWSASYEEGIIQIRTDGVGTGSEADDFASFVVLPYISTYVNHTAVSDTEYVWSVSDWDDSLCPVTCGPEDPTEVRTRTATCTSLDDQSTVADSFCEASRPPVTSSCLSPVCAWTYTNWQPSECPQCGDVQMYRYRNASCVDDNGIVTSSSRCDAAAREELSDPCPLATPCPHWEMTAWDSVCPSCYMPGEAVVVRERNVTCINSDGEEADDNVCRVLLSPLAKPPASDECEAGSEVVSCPTCSDGLLNGNETGIDCGPACGSVCPIVQVDLRFFLNASSEGAVSAERVHSALCSALGSNALCAQVEVVSVAVQQLQPGTIWTLVVLRVYARLSPDADSSSPTTGEASIDSGFHTLSLPGAKTDNADAAAAVVLALLMNPPASFSEALGFWVVQDSSFLPVRLGRTQSEEVCADNNGVLRAKCEEEESFMQKNMVWVIAASAVVALLVLVAILVCLRRRHAASANEKKSRKPKSASQQHMVPKQSTVSGSVSGEFSDPSDGSTENEGIALGSMVFTESFMKRKMSGEAVIDAPNHMSPPVLSPNATLTPAQMSAFIASRDGVDGTSRTPSSHQSPLESEDEESDFSSSSSVSSSNVGLSEVGPSSSSSSLNADSGSDATTPVTQKKKKKLKKKASKLPRVATIHEHEPRTKSKSKSTKKSRK